MSGVNYSLICAVREGQLERARELISSFGLCYSRAWSEGYVLLCDAIKNNHTAVAKLLLKSGAKVNTIKEKFSNSPLHFAAINGDIEVVKLLLDRGAKIDAKNQDGRTPLHDAIENEEMEVIKLLLKHRADVNARDDDGKSPLHIAAETGSLQIIECLLKYGVSVNCNKSSLKIAVHRFGQKYKKIVEALLEYGFNVSPEDANNSALLQAAVENGYLKIVEDLLKYGANVNAHNFLGFTPLHSAALNKQEEVAKLLIKYGADINAQNVNGKTPIFYAIGKANLDITKMLLASGARVKECPELLIIAAKEECIEIIEALLQHDADINASDEYGRTALHFTAEGVTAEHVTAEHTIKVEIAKLLLSKGANINAKQEDGLTALHIATKNGYKEVVKVLLEYGAEVDSKTSSGSSPLHLGAQNGYNEIIETILKFGADIDTRDEYGRTALHIASQEGHVEVVVTLLEHGSDINITCKNNHTPLSYCKFNCHHDSKGYWSDNHDHSGCSYEVTALICHIVKMKTANLYVSEQNLQLISSSYEMRCFQDECEEEIASMKCEKIKNHNISFYDILAKDTSSLAIYMRNENIVNVLKSDNYKTKFPKYASTIERNFRKGMERKELLDEGNEIFHFLFKNFPELPYDCSEKILSYLSGKELRMLIDACT